MVTMNQGNGCSVLRDNRGGGCSVPGIRIWGPGCKIVEREMSQLVILTYTVNHPFGFHDNAYCGCDICTLPEIQDTAQELYL